MCLFMPGFIQATAYNVESTMQYYTNYGKVKIARLRRSTNIPETSQTAHVQHPSCSSSAGVLEAKIMTP